MLMQVQQLSHGVIRHVPTQGADMLNEQLRIAGILGQPVQALHLHSPTARARHSPLLKCQIDAPPRCIGIPHPARRTVVGGAVPHPPPQAHRRFFSPDQGDQPSVGIAKYPL